MVMTPVSAVSLFSRLGVEDLRLAEGQRKLLHPLWVLVQQKAEIRSRRVSG